MNEFKIIQQHKKLKVLLIGETCLDQYQFCTVTKFSQEAPVPVVKMQKIQEKTGMAANVLNNLESLNVNVTFITNTEKIYKTRIIDEKSSQQLLRIDHDPTVALWDQQLPDNLDNFDAIIISDYNKGFLDYSSIEQIISRFQGKIFIDTKKTDLKRFSKNNVFVKINEVEYSKSVSKPRHLIVTRGAKGTQYFYNRKELYPNFEVTKKNVLDVCGAGDTFLAAFAVQYLFTNDIKLAIIFANKAAEITVQHLGNYAPTFKEICNA